MNSWNIICRKLDLVYSNNILPPGTLLLDATQVFGLNQTHIHSKLRLHGVNSSSRILGLYLLLNLFYILK